MKKLLYMAVAAIAALSSCSDDVNDNLNVNPNVNPNPNAPVFTATIEGEGETRTQLVEGSTTGKKKVEWLSTDKVFVSSFTAENSDNISPIALGVYTVAPSSEDASSATLTPENLLYSAEGTPNVVIGIYPASVSVFAGEGVTFEDLSEEDLKMLPLYSSFIKCLSVKK